MATKKTKSKTTKKTTTRISVENRRLTAAASILFAGCVVAGIGTMQNNDNIKLLLVGFAAALLVFGGVLVGMSTKPMK